MRPFRDASGAFGRILRIAAFAGTCTVVLLGAVACGDEFVGIDAVSHFPREMRLVAEAEGEVGGVLITCHLDWTVEVEPHRGDLFGSAGGDAYRQVLDGSGAGIEFWGFAQSETRIRAFADGVVEVTAFRDGVPMPRVDDSRFWESVRVLRGDVTHDRDVLAFGDWSCPPMDARGDDFGTVHGYWMLVPR